ncbi:MAG: alanyl-tRNA editing protein [Herpetosiphonaceae bacterium]|nr:MAG: alanyl-tRNA editing protein [Herpetosiphonaceae bacterium]
MPVNRLYYDDPYLVRFTATLTASAEYDGQPAVALDCTAFYPEGGGQPADHGTLAAAIVLDVQERDGEVWHILDRPINLPAGAVVEGEIDWGRRHDFMQQHHGQHLLSAAFEELLGATTVSVHMGEEICTLDLDRPALEFSEAMAAEELTNEIIWENRPIQARFVDEQELRSLPLRKQPSVDGPIRIVSVQGFDHSPCGGTHPRRTGEVGSVVIRRWERRGQTTRVEFICGRRALHDYRRKNTILSAAASSLSVAAAELPEAIRRLRQAEETSRKALWKAQEQLLAYEAAELVAGAAELPSGARIVTATFAGRSPEQVRLLARLIGERGAIALLGLRGETAQLIFSRPPQLALDVGALLREAVIIVGGRGGGRPEFAQGGGPDVEQLDRALEHARRSAEVRL